MSRSTDPPRVEIVLFTRDLRVHDNPALHAACQRADRVVPLFVLDDGILTGGFNRPNRARFLSESLADLDASLRDRSARLVVRRGRFADEVARVVQQVGASVVHVAHDVSGYAARREQSLHDALAETDCEFVVHEDSLFVVPPGRITPAGKQHMAVFTPYFRRWQQERPRAPLAAPGKIVMPRIAAGSVPSQDDICTGDTAPSMAAGGETAGRAQMSRWLRSSLADYGSDAKESGSGHDALAADDTSRLSPYLHFGCLSPVELASRAAESTAFVRQIAWRDFHHQVLAARPDAVRTDYRTRGDRWRRSPSDLEAWKQGRTGLPVVDAGMRQLLAEGWMHNRARLIVGHVLAKTLYLDWRLGAQHFLDHLIDGDTANNTMNWQWVAGTGTDSRFNRTYNVTEQARRYDPDGAYVRRYVPELAGLEGFTAHEPWKLPEDERAALDYPQPIVDVQEGNARFLAARGR